MTRVGLLREVAPQESSPGAKEWNASVAVALAQWIIASGSHC